MHNIQVQRLKRLKKQKAKKHKHAAENRCQKRGLTPHPQNTDTVGRITSVGDSAFHMCLKITKFTPVEISTSQDTFNNVRAIVQDTLFCSTNIA